MIIFYQLFSSKGRLMGSVIELNDTLKLKKGAGFPEKLEEGRRYAFRLSDRRLFHLAPIRVFLVEEVNGKWNYKGHALILEQTIDAIANETSGIFEVVKIYSAEYAKLLNINEPPLGKGLLE